MKFIFFIALVFAKLSIADNFLSNGGPFGTPTSDNKNTLEKNCISLASYPDGKLKGVKKSDLNADEAIKACQKAVQEYPNKFLYKTLLARSLEKKLDFREALKLFIVAAENGEKYAQEALAAYYFNGNLVEKDFKKAFDLSLLSAKQGNSEAMFAVAFNFFNGYGTDINIDKALKWYEKAAKAKNERALYNLGHMYENGDKVNQNYNKAYEFYFKAAELGEARSQYSIARFYANGFGVKANQFEAFKWFKKAANNIDAIPEAMTNLGYCYGNGVGTKIDNKKALKWYLKAAKTGNPIAQHNIATFYETGTYIKKDLSKAYSWYYKAANQGYDKSEYNLGSLYLNGLGVKQNNKEAIKWFKKAAAKGLPQAQYNLGLIYTNESFGELDYKEGIKWYKEAAEKKFPEALYNLAIFYENGTFLKKDIGQAFNLYLSAANLGLNIAQYNLAYYYQDGKFVEKDLNKAYEWFLKASKQGMHEAIHQIAYYLELGLGNLEKDTTKAIELYQKAALKNNVFSQIRLGQLFEEENNKEKEKTSSFWYKLAINNPSINNQQKKIAENYLLRNELENDLNVNEYKNNKENDLFIVTDSNDKIKIYMPEGFCNGNDKEYGRNYLNHLINTAKRADSKLVPKFVFYPCTRKSDYPVGMIQIHPERNQYFSQEHLNNDMMKDMGDPKVLKEVVEASEKINKSHKESKNKIVIKEFNKPQALWKDSNTFILTLRLKGEFDGEEIIEVQTISVTYYKGYLIYYYINELEENSIPGHNIKLLTDVAKKIKSEQIDNVATTENNINQIKNLSNEKSSSIELDVNNYKSTKKRLALLVANQSYKSSPLTNPINDIRLISNTLKNKGFKVFIAENLDYKNFIKALNSFKESIKKSGSDTVVLFYYAGHGLQYEGNNFLIPINSNITNSLDIELESVNLKRVFSSMFSTKGVKIILLDACRNNPYKSFMRSPSRGLVQVKTPSGTIIGYSTAPGEVAEDGFGKNSPYALAFNDAIQLANKKIEEVLKETRISVMQRTTNKQIPWDSSSLTKEFYFTID